MFVSVLCMNEVSLLCISPPVENERTFQSVYLRVLGVCVRFTYYGCHFLTKCLFVCMSVSVFAHLSVCVFACVGICLCV